MLIPLQLKRIPIEVNDENTSNQLRAFTGELIDNFENKFGEMRHDC